jgi:hypothetical protein
MMNKYLKTLLFAAGFAGTLNAFDDGPRMYWNGAVGTNILQTYYWRVHGNSLTPEGVQNSPDIEATIDLGVVGYNRIVDLAGHSVILTGTLTAGSISTSVANTEKILSGSSRGLGDLYLQAVVNLFGAPALSPEAFTDYKQGTVLSLLVGVTAPTGDYEASRQLNMGANRWNVRLGLPFMQTLGDWIPGEITTLELLPSVWFYGNNEDYTAVGLTLEQDPMLSLEAHLTRDITTSLFVSLDYFIQRVGNSFTNGIQTGSANTSDSLGLTFGYTLNTQTQLQLRYASALNPDPAQGELDADIFQFNVNYFW